MDRLETIISIAERAGEKIMNYYDKPEIHWKEDQSPVTQADLESDRFIREKLTEYFPGIPIISEESNLPGYEERKDWEEFWLVDPLDGTKEFIKKNGEFTVNIALISKGIPILGVVFAPAMQLLYAAEEGKGSWKKNGTGQRKQIFSSLVQPDQPLRVVTSRSHKSDKLVNFLSDFQIAEELAVGSSIKFCFVAEGKADFYPRFGPTMEWDVAAGDCIFRYSGKNTVRVSDLKYNKPDLRNNGFVIGMEQGSIFK